MYRARQHEEPLPSLSWLSLLVVLAASLAVFFGLHPDWRHLDVAQADANILWSYAPIPPLVLLCLVLERKLRLASFLLETLKVLMIKFVITYLFANFLWIFDEAPRPVEEARSEAPVVRAEDPFAPRTAPTPTPIDPERTRTVSGRVVDEDGVGVPGIALWVSAGLDGLHFAAPPEPLEITNAGAGFEPGLSLLQTWRRLVLRRSGTELHTARATDYAGREVFHLPALSEGGRELMLDRPHGPVRIACTVHGAAERAAWVVVVGSPWAAITDVHGAFALEGVPEQARSIAFWAPDGSTRSAAIESGELVLRWP